MKMYKCIVDGTFFSNEGNRHAFHHEDAYFASCVSDVESAVLKAAETVAERLGWDNCEIAKISVVACY